MNATRPTSEYISPLNLALGQKSGVYHLQIGSEREKEDCGVESHLMQRCEFRGGKSSWKVLRECLGCKIVVVFYRSLKVEVLR